jgi:hypothetical protein
MNTGAIAPGHAMVCSNLPEVTMSGPSEPDPRRHVKLKTLRCRRTGQMFTVEKHVECPYCFGDEGAVRKGGQYKDFCEFKPGDDPVSFGFPPDSTRSQHG